MGFPSCSTAVLTAIFLLTITSIAKTQAASNTYRGYLNFACSGSSGVKSTSSLFSNYYRDRMFSFSCTDELQGTQSALQQYIGTTYTTPTSYTSRLCSESSGYFLQSVRSSFFSSRLDRSWQIGCRQLQSASLIDCSSTSYVNSYSGYASYSVADERVITGMTSFFSSSFADRVWTYRSCSVFCDLASFKVDNNGAGCQDLPILSVSPEETFWSTAASPFAMVCEGSSILTGFQTLFQATEQDRKWSLTCKSTRLALDSEITWTAVAATGLSQLAQCGPSQAAVGMRSAILPGTSARIYSVACKTLPGTLLSGCEWQQLSKAANGVDTDPFVIGATHVVNGFTMSLSTSTSQNTKSYSIRSCLPNCLPGLTRKLDGSCKLAPCPELQLQNGVVSGDCEGMIGDKCSYDSCNEGYRLSATVERTCLIDGTWTGSAPVCLPITCGPYSSYRAFYTGSCFGNFGDRCVFSSCYPGYFRQSGSSSLVCGENGWEGISAVCSVNKCDRISVEDATLSGSCSGTLDGRCTVKCDNGFHISGEAQDVRTSSLSCRGSTHVPASWSSSIPTCERDVCEPLSFENGFLQGNCDGDYGDECSFVRCKDGYTFAPGYGPTTRVCELGKRVITSGSLFVGFTSTTTYETSWSKWSPRCIPVKCPVVQRTNAQLSPECTSGEQSSICSISCNSGFVAEDSLAQTAVCQLGADRRTASWSSEITECKELRCPTLSLAKGTMASPCSGEIGMPCDYGSCSSGYALSSSGDMRRFCWQSDGLAYWSGTEKTCIQKINADPNEDFSFRCDPGYALSFLETDRQDIDWKTYNFACESRGSPSTSRVFTISEKVHQMMAEFEFECPEENTAISGISAVLYPGRPSSLDFKFQRFWSYECALLAGATLVNCQKETVKLSKLFHGFRYQVEQGRVITGISADEFYFNSITTCDVQCNADQGFRETIHGKCERLQCPTLTLMNGVVSGDCDGDIGTACTYASCDEGYEMSAAGSTRRRCEVLDGAAVWTGSAKVCTPVATTASPDEDGAADPCEGLSRTKDASTCQDRCSEDGKDAVFFAKYGECTHVCTCGCRANYRIAANADECSEHCTSFDAQLFADFRDQHEGCPNVCFCQKDDPDDTDQSRDLMLASISQEGLRDFPFSRYGYTVGAMAGLPRGATPTGSNMLFDDLVLTSDTTLSMMSDVTDPHDCLAKCDLQPDCFTINIELTSTGLLTCTLLTQASGTEQGSGDSISIKRDRAINVLQTPSNQLDTIMGDGTRHFDMGATTSEATGLPNVGQVSRVGGLFALVPMTSSHVVALLDTFASTFSILAGTGEAGWGGVGESATTAQLNRPTAAVTDIFGRVYIAEEGNHRISCMSTINPLNPLAESGPVLDVVIGTGRAGHRGMGGSGRAALIDRPQGLAFDMFGQLYISDSGNDVIYQYDTATEVIQLFAGTPGRAGFRMDSGSALKAQLNNPTALAMDHTDELLYVADTDNNRIRAISIFHDNIRTVAGRGPAGDGAGVFVAVAPRDALLNHPRGIALDREGEHLLISDTENHVLRVMSLTEDDGVLQVAAGSAHRGYNGNNEKLDETKLNFPQSVFQSYDMQSLVFVDQKNNRIRRVWADLTCPLCTFMRPSGCNGHSTSVSCAVALDGSWTTTWWSSSAKLDYFFGRKVRLSYLIYAQSDTPSQRAKEVTLKFSDSTEQLILLEQDSGRHIAYFQTTSDVESVTLEALSFYDGASSMGFREARFYGVAM